MSTRFANRTEAGRLLASAITPRSAPIALGLPRGGVVVASEVAAFLHCPLDVILVRKVGLPSHPELAIGAIGEAGTEFYDKGLIRRLGVGPEELAVATRVAEGELADRQARYRLVLEPLPIAGRNVLVIDDGIATGSTAHAALLVARAAGVASVVLAAPVGPRSLPSELVALTDEIVVLSTPQNFDSVGAWYDDFGSVTSERVLQILTTEAHHRQAAG